MTELREKLGLSTILTVAKCGGGHHFKIPPKIVRSYELEPGDEIHVDLNTVKRAVLKEQRGKDPCPTTK